MGDSCSSMTYWSATQVVSACATVRSAPEGTVGLNSQLNSGRFAAHNNQSDRRACSVK